MSANDPLLQAFHLKHLKLRNRILSTSHEPAYSVDGLPKERYRLYHEEKAKGGIALTMFGGSSLVAPDSPPAFGNLQVGTDTIIPYFQELAAGVHRHGAALMCQITHLGRRTFWNDADWLPVISSSPIREPSHRSFPKAMEEFDIRRVVKAYGAAARRCKQGGLDGVEVEAYGHLLDAFWSPLTNQRTDAYGGSLENRMRFGLEVLEEVRKQVGEAYIVGIRMVCDEELEGGLRLEEALKIAERLHETSGLDFISVIRGHIETEEALSHVIPGMGTPAGPHLEFSGHVRKQLGIPTFHAARIQDVATARHAIQNDLLDMVGMTRAHMADPHIVAKLVRGEEEQIRPCVGMSYCLDRIYINSEALCIHNVATGRESTMPHVILKSSNPSKRVVVVGAGPAGLEAARVSASRGHAVTLFEASDRPGGQVVLAAQVKRRREVQGITDWLFDQVQRLGVEVRLNCYAEVEDVQAENPDIVIIATGGLPNTEFLESGVELATSTWDILGGSAKPAAEVLLYDDNGQHPGYSCAEHLALAGSKLELVTPERILAPEIGGTNYPAYLKCYSEYNVTLTLNHRLRSLRRAGGKLIATFDNEYTHTTVERRADQVVVEHGTLPLDGLYHELRSDSANLGEVDLDALIANRPQQLTSNPEGTFELFRVGDAVASRNIHAAIYDSLRLCKEF